MSEVVKDLITKLDESLADALEDVPVGEDWDKVEEKLLGTDTKKGVVEQVLGTYDEATEMYAREQVDRPEFFALMAVKLETKYRRIQLSLEQEMRRVRGEIYDAVRKGKAEGKERSEVLSGMGDTKKYWEQLTAIKTHVETEIGRLDARGTAVFDRLIDTERVDGSEQAQELESLQKSLDFAPSTAQAKQRIDRLLEFRTALGRSIPTKERGRIGKQILSSAEIEQMQQLFDPVQTEVYDEDVIAQIQEFEDRLRADMVLVWEAMIFMPEVSMSRVYEQFSGGENKDLLPVLTNYQVASFSENTGVPILMNSESNPAILRQVKSPHVASFLRHRLSDGYILKYNATESVFVLLKKENDPIEIHPDMGLDTVLSDALGLHPIEGLDADFGESSAEEVLSGYIVNQLQKYVREDLDSRMSDFGFTYATDHSGFIGFSYKGVRIQDIMVCATTQQVTLRSKLHPMPELRFFYQGQIYDTKGIITLLKKQFSEIKKQRLKEIPKKYPTHASMSDEALDGLIKEYFGVRKYGGRPIPDLERAIGNSRRTIEVFSPPPRFPRAVINDLLNCFHKKGKEQIKDGDYCMAAQVSRPRGRNGYIHILQRRGDTLYYIESAKMSASRRDPRRMGIQDRLFRVSYMIDMGFGESFYKDEEDKDGLYQEFWDAGTTMCTLGAMLEYYEGGGVDRQLAIHGTAKERTVDQLIPASGGCARMTNKDIVELYLRGILKQGVIIRTY